MFQALVLLRNPDKRKYEHEYTNRVGSQLELEGTKLAHVESVSRWTKAAHGSGVCWRAYTRCPHLDLDLGGPQRPGLFRRPIVHAVILSLHPVLVYSAGNI